MSAPSFLLRPARSFVSILIAALEHRLPCSMHLRNQESAPSTSGSQVEAVRHATKKAGGNAAQDVGSQPKNLGVKLTDGELVFPGMVIVRQRGTKFHPGYNVGMGRDHTLFAKAPGFLLFGEEKTAYGKDRRVVSVRPVNDDWTNGYKSLADALIQRRAQIKRSMLDTSVPREPAMHYPLTVQQGKLSWRGPRQLPVALQPSSTPAVPQSKHATSPKQASKKGKMQ